MKKFLNNQFFMIIAAMIFFGVQKVNAQTTLSQVKSIMRDRGWIATADSRYAYLKEGESTTDWYRIFYSTLEYAIVAYSDDEDVLDIDLQLNDAYGEAYIKDDEFDEFSILQFTPAYTISLGIKMTNYSSIEKYLTSKCNYTIFYRTTD